MRRAATGSSYPGNEVPHSTCAHDCTGAYCKFSNSDRTQCQTNLPKLLILTVYTALVYGILYLTFVAYPYSFEFERGWSPAVASLSFISMLIGIISAAAMLAIFTKSWYAGRLAKTKELNPEDRLPPMILGSVVLPTGLCS